MYKDYYGFEEMPFNITPDPRFLYLSPKHQEALEHLRYGIQQRKGFIVLTGEVGCGKTTLCRKLLEELDEENFETVLLLNPEVTKDQLLRDILRELGVKVALNTKVDLVNKIYEVLLKQIASGKEIIMIVDESQNLSDEVLEQIRLLSNLETDNQKLLQIILMGQPEFKEKLRAKRLRQLKQRVLVYYELTPLNFSETFLYIQHRLTLAKGKKLPQFSYWALRSIFKKSKGIPRIINNLCHKSLLSAYIGMSDCVSYRHVRRAHKELRQLS